MSLTFAVHVFVKYGKMSNCSVQFSLQFANNEVRYFYLGSVQNKPVGHAATWKVLFAVCSVCYLHV